MKQRHLQQPRTVHSPCPSAGERSHTLCPSHRNPRARPSNAEGEVLDVHAMCADPPGIIRVRTSPSSKVTYYMIPLDDILEITTWWMENRPVMVQIHEARVWLSRGERGDWCGAAQSGVWIVMWPQWSTLVIKRQRSQTHTLRSVSEVVWSRGTQSWKPGE